MGIELAEDNDTTADRVVQPRDGSWEWVEGMFSRRGLPPLTAFQRSAVDLLCNAARCGPYDFANTFERADWAFGSGVRFVVPGHISLATFDGDGLTRLVFGAHDRAIRVEIEPCMRHLAITMFQRRHAGVGLDIGLRHPTLQQAVDAHAIGVRS